MRNIEIMDVPYEQIEEALKTEPQIIYESPGGKCVTYLKNFDYYYIFCVLNTTNALNNYYIKLPTKFVESNSSSYKALLEEFLKITAVPAASSNKQELVTTFNTKERILGFNPVTYNRIKYMTYGIQNGDDVEFFFCIDIVKYRDFLEKYEVRK